MTRLQMLLGYARAAARTTLRRVRHGPLRPGWSHGVETFVAFMRGLPLMRDVPVIQATRKLMDELAPSSPAQKQVEFSRVDAGGVSALWVTPKEGAGETVLLYLHGGGYVLGSARSYRATTSGLAVGTGVRVLVPDYRLAPEHPYPAALEDALAVWRWLRSSGVEASRVVVAGDSAGGGLTLALLRALVEAGEPLPAGAVLLSPWVDLSCAAASHVDNAPYDMLTREGLLEWARFYAGALDLADPRVSPLHASPRGLPPLYVQVGGVELFRDAVCQFAERARAEGIPVTLDSYEDMPHVPCGLAAMSPRGREAFDKAVQAVRRMLEGAAPAVAPKKAAG
jgi:acetyl esterase/lipase